MKRILTLIALGLTAATASAQYYYPDSKNPEMMRHAERHEPCRTEVVLPQVNGYNVYKADLHTHTVYSDGQVLPKWRVYEAWLDGLDVMAVTEHVEYRPHEKTFYEYLKKYSDKEYKGGRSGVKQDCPMVDLNFAVRESEKEALKYDITIIPGTEITRDGTKVGHFNALFTTDNNLIYDDDHVQAIRNAKAQGALVMQNHPGWRRKDLSMLEFETKVYNEGLIDGIEIMNGAEFYPKAIDRASSNGFFMTACTDAHNSTYEQYRLNGEIRNHTLIFAKDKSLESVREALEARRTLAYAFGSLAGEEQLLKDFFNAAVSVEVAHVNAKGTKTVNITNNTSFPYLLDFGGNPVLLNPFCTHRTSVGKDADLKFSVANMWCSEKGHPQIVIKVD